MRWWSNHLLSCTVSWSRPSHQVQVRYNFAPPHRFDLSLILVGAWETWETNDVCGSGPWDTSLWCTSRPIITSYLHSAMGVFGLDPGNKPGNGQERCHAAGLVRTGARVGLGGRVPINNKGLQCCSCCYPRLRADGPRGRRKSHAVVFVAGRCEAIPTHKATHPVTLMTHIDILLPDKRKTSLEMCVCMSIVLGCGCFAWLLVPTDTLCTRLWYTQNMPGFSRHARH